MKRMDSRRSQHATAWMLLLSLLAAAPALAHDTWLLPRAWRPAAGDSLSLDLTSGMHFPNLDAPMKPERIVRTGCRRGARWGRPSTASKRPCGR